MAAAVRTPKKRGKRGVSAVLWRSPDHIDVDPALVARALISVLRGLPQAGPSAPGAALPGGLDARGGRGELAQAQKPISYRELDETWLFDGLAPPGIDSARPTAPREQLNSRGQTALEEVVEKLSARSRAGVSPGHGGRRIGAGVNRKRPGKGGRQPRATGAAISSLSAPLREKLGSPETRTEHGVTMEIFRHTDTDGNRSGPSRRALANGPGGVLTRMSSREINEGETMMGQLQPLDRFCEQNDLCPALTIATYNNGGGQDAEDRIDFVELERAIRAGEIEWVLVRDLDRLVRNDMAKATIFKLLQDTGTDLYIAGWGRKVDWGRDYIQVQAEAMFTEHERLQIGRRTRTAINIRYVAEGRGVPGSARFGFYRDQKTKDMCVDDKQWDFVKLIHYRYDELNGKRGSLRQIRKELVAKGCEFSEGHIAVILRDPIYVTGEWTTNVGGTLIENKPIPIPEKDRIPADLFQRNQQRLAMTRGSNTKTPLGWYLLNGIDFVHEGCADELVDNNHGGKRRAKLMGRGCNGNESPSAIYSHRPRVPGCCKGWNLDSLAVDRAVASELRRLAHNRALQEEWANAPRIDPAKAAPVMTKQQIEQLEDRIRQLEGERLRLEKEVVDRLANDEQLSSQEILDTYEPVKREIAQIERRIEVAKAAPAQVINPTKGSSGSVLWGIAQAGGIDPTEHEFLVRAFDEILTDEPPEDPEHLCRRAALVKACLSRVTAVDVEEDEGAVNLILEGPLIPDGVVIDRAIDPVESAAEVLRCSGAPLATSTGTQRSSKAGNQPAQPDPVTYEQYRDQLFAPPAASSARTNRAKQQPRKPIKRGRPAWISPPILLRRARMLDYGRTFETCLDALRWSRERVPEELQLSRKRHDEAIRRARATWPRSKKIALVAKECGLDWAGIRALALTGGADGEHASSPDDRSGNRTDDHAKSGKSAE